MKSTGKSSAGYHRLEDLMVCPRRFGYRELEHLVPYVMPKPLALGTCVHDALAALYLGHDPMAALLSVNARAAYRVPMAKQIVREYVKQKASERVHVLAVEEEYGIKLHGRLFTRRMDLVVEDEGRVKVRDHKTSGDAVKRKATFGYDASLFTQWIIGERILPAKFQLPWGGVQVNLISTRPPYPARYHPVFWSSLLLKDALSSLDYWTEQAAKWIARGVSGWSLPQSWRCQGQYGECDYLPLCLTGEKALGSFTVES